MKIDVTYMSGAGNIFAVVNNLNKQFNSLSFEKLAVDFCNKSYNGFIQAEGLMVLESGNDEYDFICRYFNPDGSTGMMCGNGGRCISRFARLKGALGDADTTKFLMAGDTYYARFEDEAIALRLPPPIEIKQMEFNVLHYSNVKMKYVNVNTDHIVVDYDSLGSKLPIGDYNLPKFAQNIVNSGFFPKGVNVNLYSKNDNGSLDLRTFERGVDAETGACGTGAVSTGITAVLDKNITFPVVIYPTSKEKLEIESYGDFPDKIEYLELKGPAKVLRTFTFNIEN